MCLDVLISRPRSFNHCRTSQLLCLRITEHDSASVCRTLTLSVNWSWNYYSFPKTPKRDMEHEAETGPRHRDTSFCPSGTTKPFSAAVYLTLMYIYIWLFLNILSYVKLFWNILTQILNLSLLSSCVQDFLRPNFFWKLQTNFFSHVYIHTWEVCKRRRESLAVNLKSCIQTVCQKIEVHVIPKHKT